MILPNKTMYPTSSLSRRWSCSRSAPSRRFRGEAVESQFFWLPQRHCHAWTVSTASMRHVASTRRYRTSQKLHRNLVWSVRPEFRESAARCLRRELCPPLPGTRANYQSREDRRRRSLDSQCAHRLRTKETETELKETAHMNNNKGKEKTKRKHLYKTFSKNDKGEKNRLKKHTRPLVLGHRRNEGHEIAAAEELRDEQGGVALSLRVLDPLEARPQNAWVAASLSKNAAPVATHLPWPSDLLSPAPSPQISDPTVEGNVFLELEAKKKVGRREWGLEDVKREEDSGQWWG